MQQHTGRPAIWNIQQSVIHIILLVIGLQQTASAQNIVFNSVSVENGLSSNSVLAIAQDGQGFMWYGTRYGLNRYDGRNFKVYHHSQTDSNSLGDDYVNTLTCSKGTLWAGTPSGLCFYNAAKDAFEKIPLPTNGNNAKSNNILTLYADGQGNIWAGVENGLHKISTGNRNSIQSFYAADVNGLAGSMVRCIYQDADGGIWVGTNNGLTHMRKNGGGYRFQSFRHNPQDAASLSDNIITSICGDTQNNIWIGTQNGGLNLVKKGVAGFQHFVHTASPTSLVNNNIRKIIADKTGKMWVGTQEGISIYHPASNNFTNCQHDPGNKKSLSQNSVYSLFEDANGSIWAGTYFGGANITYSYGTPFKNWQNTENPAGLSNNVVSSIVEDAQHNLWIGTEGGGLNYYNRGTNLFTTYKSNPEDNTALASNLIKVLYKDSDGNIWIGTHGGGISLADAPTGKFKRFLYKPNDAATLSDEVVTLQEDAAGNLWAGTQKGLRIFKRDKNNLEPLDMPIPAGGRQSVKALFKDSRQHMWVGTNSGLYEIINGAFRQHRNEYINCITGDVAGNIWVGLNYGGLLKYNAATQNFTLYTEKDGLPNNNVVGILEDNERNLWVSTENGLSKFTPGNKQFQNYTISDGLAGNEFNYNSFYKSSGGEFFFGGYNGLTAFYPNAIQTNKHGSPIVFTGLKLFNNPVQINGADGLLQQNISLTQSLRFKHNQNVFTIDFALLNFIKSGKNKYRYQLQGFDKNWNEVSTASATYTNLPSGYYTLLVKGANNDGVWSQPASLRIQVLPPFWLTWWAFCLYALFVAAIVFLVTRFFYLRALVKREDDLHQVKLNFFTNVSHEIRTHLTLIMAPVDKLLDTQRQDSFVQQQLGNVKTNANRLLKLVSELMDFRKAETNNLKLQVAQQNLVPFLEEIFSSFQDLSQAKNIHTSFVYAQENVPLYFDREQLEKVFFNLLTNAFKFTPEGGSIGMNLEQQDSKVLVTITDNGHGIAPEYLDKLFNNFFQVADHGQQNTGYGIGLALTKNIVELHGGTIAVESQPATATKSGKTSFSVALPQGNKHLEGHSITQLAAVPEKAVTSHPQPIAAMATAAHNDAEIIDKPFTILISEDTPALRQLISETFEHQYNIILTENGLQGWEQATEQLPDLIISDVMMPEMDGFTLCTKLKTDERTSHVPVILLTAKSSQTDQISGLETGADMYLTKPFSPKVLELNVRNLLAGRERMRQRYSQQITQLPAVITTETVPTTEIAAEAAYQNPVDRAFLDKVIALVHGHMEDPEFGVAMLSRKVAMSAPILYKKLKAVTDMSVNDFVKSLRLKKAAELLAERKYTVYEVAYTVGYNDRKHFSKEFKKLYGKTPTEYAEAQTAV